jgi:NAD(P)-dependent dehydrogenase (short-subunit alcohol dehydrogenase family)
MADSRRLAGKVAVVTGAANGIGAGCALAFANAGAKVYGLDIASGQQVTGICDMTDEAAVDATIQDIGHRDGRIDILVNAAAIAIFKWIEDLSYAEWRATLTGELDTVFLAVRAAWPFLKSGGAASVINFSSANAHHALAGSPALAHVAGKGGVLAMTRQLAMEGAAHGIRANCIAPGFILTAATGEHIAHDPDFERQVLAKNMIKRLGTPQDVAAAAIWLASDEASYVTGAEIPVDAGATAW